MKFIKTDTDVNLFENIIETESQVVTHLASKTFHTASTHESVDLLNGGVLIDIQITALPSCPKFSLL